jgi:hypothetical protein
MLLVLKLGLFPFCMVKSLMSRIWDVFILPHYIQCTLKCFCDIIWKEVVQLVTYQKIKNKRSGATGWTN